MNHIGAVPIQTRRLHLRRASLADARALYENFLGDPQACHYLGLKSTPCIAETNSLLSAWIASYAHPRFYLWILELKETHQPIGLLRVVRCNEMKGSLELGYGIGEAWWGRGLATEAIRAVCETLFTHTGALVIEAFHDTRNPSSGRVLEKAGLALQGTLTAADAPMELAHYAVYAKDFFARNIVCPWALQSPIEREYHDLQWGQPVRDDALLFELLVLEWMQAGLSWRIILEKREGMREAFDGFDLLSVSQYTEEKILQLLQNPSIIRNRKKLEALAINAKAFLKIQREEGSFAAYIWHFTQGKTIHGNWKSMMEIPSKSPLSEKISRDMKKRGFVFLGPVIVYSYLQAIGILDDHLQDCFVKK